MAASPDTLLEAEAAPERGHRMLHYQHPERPGEAFCGADVVGIVGRFGRVDCVVCGELMREYRRGVSGVRRGSGDAR